MYFEMMNPHCHYISYEQTNAFSKIVLDYLEANKHLQPFYQYEPSLSGIRKAINDRKKYSIDRKILIAMNFNNIQTSVQIASITSRDFSQFDFLLF